jgi:hypothetical protein
VARLIGNFETKGIWNSLFDQLLKQVTIKELAGLFFQQVGDLDLFV